MTKKIITKLTYVVYVVIAILFIMLPIQAKATNEKLAIISTTTIDAQGNKKEEYIIYIKDYIDKNFKYAFSNAESTELIYINSIIDTEGNQVAFLDSETYENLANQEQQIYLWAKDENGNPILEGIELDLNNVLTKEETATVELITKRIQTEIADTKEKVDATEPARQEKINEVDEIAKVGYVKITDSESATYYYQMVKASDSAELSTLKEYAERLNTEYRELNIYNKIQFCTEFYDLYSKLTEQAKWQEVNNMIINQPEESKEGEEYILFIKKVEGETETIDAQFLTASEDYKENVITEQIVTQETAKLPITFDSIVLFVLLGIVVIALIVIFIRIKILSKKNEK